MSTPDPGWYPAPDRAGFTRYWDGVQWTDQYQAAGPPSAPDLAQSPNPHDQAWWPAPTAASRFALDVGLSPGTLQSYASFGARAGATVVDSIIVLVVSFALGAAVGTLIYIVYGDIDDETFFVVSGVVGFFIDYVLVLLLYWWYFSKGWSPGRALVGIRIVDAHGLAPGSRRGLGRLLMSFVSGLALGIGYLAMLWSPLKQTWHDAAAGTFVIRTR